MLNQLFTFFKNLYKKVTYNLIYFHHHDIHERLDKLTSNLIIKLDNLVLNQEDINKKLKDLEKYIKVEDDMF